MHSESTNLCQIQITTKTIQFFLDLLSASWEIINPG